MFVMLAALTNRAVLCKFNAYICEIVLGRRESLLVQNKEKLDTLLVESPLPDKIFQCTVSTLCLDQQDVPGHWSILETRTLSNGKSPYTLRFDKLSNTPAVLVRLRPQKHVVGIQLSLSFRILRGKRKMCWWQENAAPDICDPFRNFIRNFCLSRIGRQMQKQNPARKTYFAFQHRRKSLSDGTLSQRWIHVANRPILDPGCLQRRR